MLTQRLLTDWCHPWTAAEEAATQGPSSLRARLIIEQQRGLGLRCAQMVGTKGGGFFNGDACCCLRLQNQRSRKKEEKKRGIWDGMGGWG
jgi:hypothetical protein